MASTAWASVWMFGRLPSSWTSQFLHSAKAWSTRQTFLKVLSYSDFVYSTDLGADLREFLQAAARANILYYDLGGTYCACEKQWNVQEYWGKTFSGLAFNLPHFIDLAKILIKYSLRWGCTLMCWGTDFSEYMYRSRRSWCTEASRWRVS